MTVLLMYVDDILITGNNLAHVASLITHVHSTFSMKELGLINYFLGVSITPSDSGYFLSQTKYALDIITKAGMADCKPAPSPMSVKPSSLSSATVAYSNPSLYRSIVGALQYLTITRPDISFAVNHACQTMHSPTEADFASVKHLLRYLKGTLHQGLSFTPGPLVLLVFSDSDWAGSISDCRSTTGCCVFLGPNLISCSAKTQPIVSRSSTEAEYRALAQVAAELSWLQMLLTDLRITHPCPIL
ncbi:uncharacterized protein LOC114289934 [Camellia sinensis]|uniref:uncharacterized protein LOC114289934 n=1 Tax=Camellia sinensis TaxID=4442 RepID=UPI001035D5BB|nr:uncharacterized protein LOC114289934 [Camellia sinensis]